ncbi:MAG: hypothetical protein J4452_02640 [Candidatus Aenigmarchaeota archaeon]|nr:hypothetical protein [Candidatus Aenigmarchaeota archaeon]
MDADTINLIGIIALFLVIIIVSILIIQSQGLTLGSQIPTQLGNVFKKFVSTVIQTSPYNICEAYAGKEISIQDFQTLLQAVYQGQCGDVHANVSLTFSLTQEDIIRISKLSGIAGGGNLIFYNLTKPLGVGALIIIGNQGDYPLKTFDFVDMWQQGSPSPDTFIARAIKGCDPTDNICDASCILKRVCDPVCDDGQRHGIPCNLACIDSNNNGVVDIDDSNKRISDGKCNPDCYSDRLNPLKAYDPGCEWLKLTDQTFRQKYGGICDPNSNGVKDGICDQDCIKDKNICDPDCNGIVYPGNPNGTTDSKCFVCDKTCNSWCSPSCTVFDNDPDCPSGAQGPRTECCGNGICNTTASENCQSCSKDCLGAGTTCSDFNFVCCPSDGKADSLGCTVNKDLKEKSKCNCNSQCATNLQCDTSGHCCPEGKIWNGTDCFFRKTYKLLFVPIDYSSGQAASFKASAQKVVDLFIKLSPLSECRNPQSRVEAVFVEPGECSVSCPYLWPLCNDNVLACAKKSKYATVYNKVVGLFQRGPISCDGSGGMCIGAARDIPSDQSVTWASYTNTVLHEIGHSQNLCHECDPSPLSNPNYCAMIGCACRGVGQDSYCPNPNVGACTGSYQDGWMMCYGAQTKYSAGSYKWLKEHELKDYMDGCGQ